MRILRNIYLLESFNFQQNSIKVTLIYFYKFYENTLKEEIGGKNLR